MRSRLHQDRISPVIAAFQRLRAPRGGAIPFALEHAFSAPTQSPEWAAHRPRQSRGAHAQWAPRPRACDDDPPPANVAPGGNEPDATGLGRSGPIVDEVVGTPVIGGDEHGRVTAARAHRMQRLGQLAYEFV